MENINLIATLTIVCLIIAAIVTNIIIIISKKKDKQTTVDEILDFISTHTSSIIIALQDAVAILQKNEADYTNKTEYEIDVINTALNIIKDRGADFGIPESIINVCDTAKLAEFIQSVFNSHKEEVYSILPADVIDKNKDLYDEETANVLTEAMDEE